MFFSLLYFFLTVLDNFERDVNEKPDFCIKINNYICIQYTVISVNVIYTFQRNTFCKENSLLTGLRNRTRSAFKRARLHVAVGKAFN